MKVCELLGNKFPPMTGALYGTELEIESVKVVYADRYGGLLNKCEEDPSLRNSGTEIISNPLSLHDSLSFFKITYNGAVEFVDREQAHSHRTSTHVHVNVLDLDINDVRNLLINYYLLEAGFFSLVDESRQNNIYCVPLSATNILSKMAAMSIGDMVAGDNWHKYTAFNMLPLRTQGTVEFRHLQGTSDVEVYKRWLTAIHNWRFEAGSIPSNLAEVFAMYKRVFDTSPTPDISEALNEAFMTMTLIMTPIGAEVLQRRIKESKACAA